jgi:DNA-binding response OmpR family regulator
MAFLNSGVDSDFDGRLRIRGAEPSGAGLLKRRKFVRALLVANKRLSRTLKHGLEKAGFTVDVAATGAEANLKIAASSYDMILLDLALSKTDGPALLRRWRKDANHGKEPGLFLLEAKNGTRGKIGRAPLKDEVLDVHDLEINLSAKTIKRAGRPIHLTRREFALLEFLALRRGTVVTRRMLKEHFYADREEKSSNIIDVYIRYLRSKIDDGFAKPLIVTRWGQGYMMRSEDD